MQKANIMAVRGSRLRPQTAKFASCQVLWMGWNDWREREKEVFPMPIQSA